MSPIGGRLLFYILLLVLLLLPLIAVAVVVAVRRSAALRHLSVGILVAGFLVALLTAGYGFLSSTMPVGPYERAGNSWLALVGSMALLLYIGFGLGTTAAALLSVPGWRLVSLIRARRAKRGESSPMAHEAHARDRDKPGPA